MDAPTQERVGAGRGSSGPGWQGGPPPGPERRGNGYWPRKSGVDRNYKWFTIYSDFGYLLTMNAATTQSDSPRLLEGRVAVVTGGAGGIGGAVTLDDNILTAPPAETQSLGSSVPDIGSTLVLLSSVLASLFAFGLDPIVKRRPVA